MEPCNEFGIELIEESILQSTLWRRFEGLVHAFSTRRGEGGHSFSLGGSQEEFGGYIEHNRRLFCKKLSVDPSTLFVMSQVHGKRVVVAEDILGCKKVEADGVITRQKNLALTIQTADCVPILLYDPIQKVIGAVHAGWRSASQGIVTEAISLMKIRFKTDPVDCHALIGPSIGPCCYEVGEDVIQHFPASVRISTESDRYRLDLWKTAGRQLTQAGIKEENILGTGLCTAHNSDLLFSYRAEGPETGRMMALILMR